MVACASRILFDASHPAAATSVFSFIIASRQILFSNTCILLPVSLSFHTVSFFNLRLILFDFPVPYPYPSLLYPFQFTFKNHLNYLILILFPIYLTFIPIIMAPSKNTTRAPKPVKTPRKKQTYPLKNLELAMKMVKEEQWSKHGAASFYGVPEKTLRRHLKEGSSLKSVGGQQALSPEVEQVLTDILNEMAK